MVREGGTGQHSHLGAQRHRGRQGVGKKTYVRNAVIGCLRGEIGGVVWKFLPGWVENKAVNMVIAFIIKHIR
ncbi:hypothetical protein [Streptomyces coeruleorubidus]|uniref:hypothetical protein n=1 Tax=Streptomyces coeruleorubidus TaxID=116188 RepID=UPI0033FC8BA9